MNAQMRERAKQIETYNETVELLSHNIYFNDTAFF